MNTNYQSSSGDEESFVVLESSTDEKKKSSPDISLLTLQNLSISGADKPSFINIPSLENVMGMKPEEILQRLQELIKENCTLKTTLQQHNIAMKQQFQTLNMWQNDVYKVHLDHKEKFEETKQYITKINAENRELKKALTDRANTPKDDSELLMENIEFKKLIVELRKDLDSANQRDKKSQQKLSEMCDVVEKMTAQLENAERSKRQLIMEVEKLTALQNRKQGPLTTPIVMFEDNIYDNIQPSEQLKRYHKLCSRFDKVEDDIDRSMISYVDVESNGLPFEIKELRKLLAQEQNLSASRKERICEFREFFQRLLSDYQTIYNDLEALKQHKSSQEIQSSLEKERDDLISKVNIITEQLVEIQAVLDVRNYELNNLKNEMEKMENDIITLKSENESIEIFKEQANTYKGDFEAERKGREQLAIEKEHLSEDLRRLTRRNEELQDELKNLDRLNNKRCKHVSQSSPFDDEQNPQQLAQQRKKSLTPPKQFVCPNPECNVSFDKIEPLEVHVIKCLGLDN